MKIKFNLVITLFVALAVSSCSSIRLKPLSNISGSAVPSGLNASDVKSAILVSGAMSGWVITPSKKLKSTLNAKLMVRQHMIEVSIPYSDKEYSFTYKNSHNMFYDPSQMLIHRKYGAWIANLKKEIYMNLIRKANE
jgi:hypothetical protein